MKTKRPREPRQGVVLMSGGLDSCVTAAIAHAEGYRLFGLHVSYGQRTERRELEAFRAQADFFPLEGRLTANLTYFRAISGSSLTNPEIAVPDQDLNSKAIPNTYVPFRNAHFISIATSWAETLEAERIFVGAVSEDSSGYPDCRPEYYEAMNQLIEVGTRPTTRILVLAPLIKMRKSEIVQRGVALGAPLGRTWSCYRESEVACGRCDSCALRLRAFQEAGFEDPIEYRERPQYAGV